MSEQAVRTDNVASRSLANPRRVRLLTAFREGKLVPDGERATPAGSSVDGRRT